MNITEQQQQKEFWRIKTKREYWCLDFDFFELL